MSENQEQDYSNPAPDQENVIADYANELRQVEIQSYERGVKRARNALYWTAGLIFFWEMIGMARAGLGFDMMVFVIALVEAGIFVGLALWTKTKPYTAVVSGLIAFIGIMILGVVAYGIVDGSEGVLKALISGIIVKVIILVNLIKALSDAKALQELKKEI